MFSTRYLRAITLVLAVFVSPYAATAAGNFTTFDYPEAAHTYALGNNPAGYIVGAYVDTNGDEHGFLWNTVAFTTLDYPDALWTDAYGINPRGDVVGQYGWFDGVNYITRGFLYRGGNFYALDVTGHQNTMPFKISPNGTIVGCNHHNLSANGGTDMNTMYGFTLGGKGALDHTLVRSMNTGVNADGDVVGYYYGTSAWQPSSRAEWSYLIREGNMTLFQYPAAWVTIATDISSNGTIIGRYRDQSPTRFHGFFLRNGQFEAFDAPGSSNTYPFGINPNGQVVGYYAVGTGNSAVAHGFIFQ